MLRHTLLALLAIAGNAQGQDSASSSSSSSSSYSSSSSPNSSWTPLVFMHGLTGSFHDWDEMISRLKAVHPGQFLQALDVYNDAASLLPIWEQMPLILDTFRNVTKDLDSYNIVCHSQGGIICRALVESLEHNVKSFISLAGVQQGVRAIPPEVTSVYPPRIDAHRVLFVLAHRKPARLHHDEIAAIPPRRLRRDAL
jgi:pimeloyl-ACP methyl ester carboxylesterase